MIKICKHRKWNLSERFSNHPCSFKNFIKIYKP